VGRREGGREGGGEGGREERGERGREGERERGTGGEREVGREEGRRCKSPPVPATTKSRAWRENREGGRKGGGVV